MEVDQAREEMALARSGFTLVETSDDPHQDRAEDLGTAGQSAQVTTSYP